MKTLMVAVLAGVTYLAAGPAFAGRDQSQIMAQQAAMEAKKANNLAQTGLAGPTGAPGKVGPGTQSPNARRDPSAHP